MIEIGSTRLNVYVEVLLHLLVDLGQVNDILARVFNHLFCQWAHFMPECLIFLHQCSNSGLFRILNFVTEILL